MSVSLYLIFAEHLLKRKAAEATIARKLEGADTSTDLNGVQQYKGWIMEIENALRSKFPDDECLPSSVNQMHRILQYISWLKPIEAKSETKVCASQSSRCVPPPPFSNNPLSKQHAGVVSLTFAPWILAVHVLSQ